MDAYFYFGGLLIGFMWTFQTLRGSQLDKYFKQNQVWQIRSAYTLLALLGGHVMGSIFKEIYLMFQGVL